jgi:hypothetical protein
LIPFECKYALEVCKLKQEQEMPRLNCSHFQEETRNKSSTSLQMAIIRNFINVFNAETRNAQTKPFPFPVGDKK